MVVSRDDIARDVIVPTYPPRDDQPLSRSRLTSAALICEKISTKFYNERDSGPTLIASIHESDRIILFTRSSAAAEKPRVTLRSDENIKFDPLYRVMCVCLVCEVLRSNSGR